jgi:hypothetical protein
LSLALKEEHRLRMFENRMLRRILESDMEEVAIGLREMYNNKLHNMYSSQNIIRMIKSWRMRCVGHAAQIGEMRNAYKILVRKPDGKIPLGRPRCR